MPIAVTTEQLAIAESVSQWAKRAGTIAAVRARETGHAAGAPAGSGESSGRAGTAGSASGSSWSSLAGLGVFAIAQPESAGGAGGTAADVAVVAEQLAAVLAPGPVLPTLLAGLVLARRGQPGAEDVGGAANGVGADGAGSAAASEAAGELLAGVAGGTRTVAAALTETAGLTAEAQPGGGLRVSGSAGLVLGAGEASDLLLNAA
ncbi:MAG TPA: acyl-CoA dehydrogenase family protein, partial [Streptosporangiaceae bacterium]